MESNSLLAIARGVFLCKEKNMTNKTKTKVEEVSNKMEEISQLSVLESLIQNNIVEFKIEDINYRIRKPSLRENNDLNYQRMLKYQTMLKDSNYMMEDQLKKTYKEKGIDLDNMDIRLIELQRKEADLLTKVAKMKIDSEIEKMRAEVLSIRRNKSEILQRKAELLQFSIETQLTNYMNEYLLSLVLERKEKDKWIKQFNTHEDLLDCPDEELIIQSTYFLSILVYKDALQS